jgi:hypothetical protein
MFLFLIYPDHCLVNAHGGTLFQLTQSRCIALVGSFRQGLRKMRKIISQDIDLV